MWDEDDDWMNPRQSRHYERPPPKSGTFYQIQRKRAIPVSGNVSAIYRWDVWQEFEDKAERDAALERLRERHPKWHLRARSAMYLHGQEIRRPDPTEYKDF